MRLYQLDAFTDQLFAGNPAAVCPLTEWLPDQTMQQLAAENNLAETAFYTYNPDTNRYHIRWFTPAVEVDLCGHATLATAYVIFNLESYAGEADLLRFDSRSGELTVRRENNGWLVLNFPADTVQKATLQPPALLSSLGQRPLEIHKGKTDYMLIYGSQAEVAALEPNFRDLASVPARGVIATAPADEAGIHFVSRFFAPQSGIDEDPVTGSAHTTLVPYWAERLGQTELVARQISKRGGYLRCTLTPEGRVDIAGQVKLYLTGEVFL
jgi:PhzF family phenazine biosynthesis protein